MAIYPCRSCVYFKQCGSSTRTEQCNGRSRKKNTMLKPHRIERKTTRNVGDPSSKYGYDRTGEQFEADMRKHMERSEYLWNEFIEFVKSHDATPLEFRNMFTRYYEEFL